MISRRHRFHGLNSLRTVYKLGQTSRQQQLTVRYRLNDKRAVYRCAVVVSKKVEKSAVRRNRIRRRIFEAVRWLEPNIKQPYDIVITAFSNSVIDLTDAELKQQIKSLLNSAGVVDDKTQK